MLISLQYPKAYNAERTLLNSVKLSTLPVNPFFEPIKRNLESKISSEGFFYSWDQGKDVFNAAEIGSYFLIGVSTLKQAFLLDLIYKFKDTEEHFARHVGWTKPSSTVRFQNVLIFKRIDFKNQLKTEFFNKYFNQNVQIFKDEKEKEVLDILAKEFSFYIPDIQSLEEISIDKLSIENANINSLNQILYGPPGTGKTYSTKSKTIKLIKNNKQTGNTTNMDKSNIDILYNEYFQKGQIQFITFHPSYSYEDFVEGIRPELKDSTNVTFKLYSGIFKQIALNALRTLIEEDEINWGDFKDDKMKEIRNKIQKLVKSNIPNEKNYVLIIDEINRGDISKIFGELITLIEKDKRIGEQNELIVQLPYSNDYFGVPPNLYILGTMNTADRSLALIDVALRRRFDFEEMQPELNDLEKNPDKYGSEDVKDSNLFKDSIIALKKLNTTLGQNPDIGKDKKIGHAFLCNLSKEAEILPIWRSKIMPLIEEYYYFDKNSLVILTNNIYTLENGWSTEDDKIKNLIEILKK